MKECAQGYYLSSDYKCKQSTGNSKEPSRRNNSKQGMHQELGCIYHHGNANFVNLHSKNYESVLFLTADNCRSQRQNLIDLFLPLHADIHMK